MARKTAKENAVKTYRWEQPSLITQIDVREQSKGTAVAYIYATENNPVRLPELQELQELFKNKGWAASSDNRDGKSVLRLTGLTDAQELISLLEEKQKGKTAPYIAGTSVITEDAPHTHEPKGLVNNLRTHSSRLSGMFGMLGNAFYVVSGISRGKDWGQMGTGIAFSAGDVMLAAFGGKDDTRQFKSLLHKLKSHWDKNGIEIAEHSAILAETKPRSGLGERTYDFLHEHVNKVKALAEVAGGVNYFMAGRKQRLKGEPQGIWKQATAIIFSLGFGSTLFIEEKKPDQEKLKNAGFMEKANAYIHEKPLRVGGWSGLSNTLFTTIGAFKERAANPNVHHYRYDLATAGSMFFANNLYAISNKATGGSITNDDLIKDVYGLAAQVLNRIPDDQRESAIKTTVDFLGERTELKDTREEVDKLLREEMYRLTHGNPWFQARTDNPAIPDTNANRTWESRTKPEPIAGRTWEKSIARSSDSAESTTPSPAIR